jgi:hypothetical protein
MFLFTLDDMVENTLIKITLKEHMDEITPIELNCEFDSLDIQW